MKLTPHTIIIAAFLASINLPSRLAAQSMDYGMIAGFVQSPSGTNLVGGGFQLLGVTPSSGFSPVGASLSDLLNTANMLSVSNSLTTIDIANPGQFYQPGLLTLWSNGDTIADGTQLYILASTSATFSLTAPWALVTGTDVSWFSPDPDDPLALNAIEMSLAGNSIIAAGNGGPGLGAYFSPNGPGTTVSPAPGDNNVVLVPDAPPPPPSSGGSFTVRAPGGVRFLTGTNANGVSLVPGASSWASLSDRDAKNAPAPLDHRETLRKVDSLPVTSWEYKHDPGRRYVGPMAQDFHAAFGLGTDDKHLSTLDLDGVALSALQGLIAELRVRHERSAAQAARLQALETELQDLRERWAAH